MYSRWSNWLSCLSSTLILLHCLNEFVSNIRVLLSRYQRWINRHSRMKLQVFNHWALHACMWVYANGWWMKCWRFFQVQTWGCSLNRLLCVDHQNLLLVSLVHLEVLPIRCLWPLSYDLLVLQFLYELSQRDWSQRSLK